MKRWRRTRTSNPQPPSQDQRRTTSFSVGSVGQRRRSKCSYSYTAPEPGTGVLPEFLDELLQPASWQPRQRDAWRLGHYAPVTFEVELAILERLANPERLREIRRDAERLAWVRQSMVDRGPDQPLVLIVDHVGRVTMQDGHHRYLCAASLGLERLPARFEVSEQIRSYGIPVHEVLGDLVLARRV